MRIPKMCLKQSFFTPSGSYKWFCSWLSFQTVFLAVQILTPLFFTDCTKFCSTFSSYWIGNLMRIPKMCLKQLFSNSKWVFQTILSLTVLSNCVFGISNFGTAFVLDSVKFCSVFWSYWIGNLTRTPKMFLKQSFSHSKWVWHAILSLTVKLCSTVAKIRV